MLLDRVVAAALMEKLRAVIASAHPIGGSRAREWRAQAGGCSGGRSRR